MLFLPLLLHDFLKFSNLIFHIALLFLIPGSKLIGLLPLPCVIFFCPSWTANVMMRVSLGLTRHCDPNLSGPLLPGTTPSSTSSAPTSSPAIPAAAASSSSPDPAGPATYASDPSAHGAQPFPPAEKLLGNIAAIRTFLRSKPSTKCTSRSSLTKIKEENCGLRKLTSEATLEPGNLSNIETF